VYAKHFKHFAKVQVVLFACATVDEQIIKIHTYELVQEGREKLVHDSLKDRWCIFETHGQYFPFILPDVGVECCFRYIRGLQSQLMVSTGQVKSRKVLGTRQIVHEVINARYRILVVLGDLVKCTIINAHA
jgi:hypothetical protein